MFTTKARRHEITPRSGCGLFARDRSDLADPSAQTLACAQVLRMQHQRLTVALGVACACLPCGLACQQPAGELFPAITPTIEWPAGPGVARVRLIGTLSSSKDLAAEKPASEVFKEVLRGPRPPVDFTAPQGVDFHPDGLLAIADSSGASVHIIDLLQRTHVCTLGSQEYRFSTPVGVAWVERRLIVSDAAQHTLYELDVHGQLLRRLGEEALTRPVGLVFVPSARELYVVDGGDHDLKVFDLQGTLLRTLGGRGTGPGRFNFPTHIAYDGADTLAVADSANFRVQLLGLDGQVKGIIGKKGDGAGDLSLPKGVAFDSDGHLYVVDAHFENFQIFDRSGRLLLAVGQEGTDLGEFSLPAGLAIDDRDRIWVADSANSRVQVFQYLKHSNMTAQLKKRMRDSYPVYLTFSPGLSSGGQASSRQPLAPSTRQTG